MISFIKRKKLSKPGSGYNCTLKLIILGSKCNQVFEITGSESFTSMWSNFDPLFLAELF